MTTLEKLGNLEGVDSSVKRRVQEWLEGNYDAKTKQEIEKLIATNPKALVDAFYTTLSFGTGGMREIMGVGSNRMNEYTVRAATQGLSNYLLKVYGTASTISVAIGYDSRHNSKTFADCAASVFSANGIHVYLFDSLRPTPLVSFACRYKKCKSAIMVTASHNPPEYNGYKVYWDDGAQVLPPHDKGIIQEVEKITDLSQVKTKALPNSLVELIGKEVDEAYFKATKKLALYPEDDKKYGSEPRILYSNLHGTGIMIVPEALNRYGFTQVGFVEEQKEPDGNFPTTKYPNPEEREALDLGIKKLIKEKYDILIATDPDCDRIGVVVRHKDEAVPLTGNQIGAIAAESICAALKLQKRFPERAAFIKSIVTTDLFKRSVESYGGTVFEVLPGFKYIAEKIRNWESQPNGFSFIFGGEESYGFLLGTEVRDKDASISSCLMAEIALKAKREGKTLVDLLDDLYKKYGYFYEHLFSLKFEDGKEGKEAQNKLMNRLRENPPKMLHGSQVQIVSDFKKGVALDLKSKQEKKIDLPISDVLIFELADKSKVIIRPSGTEPKIKVYLMLEEPITSTLQDAEAKAKDKAQSLEKEVRKLVS